MCPSSLGEHVWCQRETSPPHPLLQQFLICSSPTYAESALSVVIVFLPPCMRSFLRHYKMGIRQVVLDMKARVLAAGCQSSSHYIHHYRIYQILPVPLVAHFTSCSYAVLVSWILICFDIEQHTTSSELP